MEMRRIRFSYFGDLKALDRSLQGNSYWWLCQCKCGKYRNVEETRLLSGEITACVPCEVRRKMEKPI
jgi:hypothetical protein